MDNKQIWTIYFTGVTSIQWHPKNQNNPERLTLEQCATIADEMLLITNERFPKCQDGAQQQQQH